MIKRALHYARRHGVRATLGRGAVAAKRLVVGGRMVCFTSDLQEISVTPPASALNATVERKNREAEISAEDLAAVTSVWNPEESKKLIRERFGRGASLWLLKKGNEVAGYGWTLIGGTIEEHYYTVNANDAHLFDFFVMPKYRGQGMNPLLVGRILASLAGEKRDRALIEAAEWNQAQLKSLRKMPFRQIGLARKFRFLGKTRIVWSR